MRKRLLILSLLPGWRESTCRWQGWGLLKLQQSRTTSTGTRGQSNGISLERENRQSNQPKVPETAKILSLRPKTRNADRLPQLEPFPPPEVAALWVKSRSSPLGSAQPSGRGNPRDRRECLFCLLSLSRLHDPAQCSRTASPAATHTKAHGEPWAFVEGKPSS